MDILPKPNDGLLKLLFRYADNTQKLMKMNLQFDLSLTEDYKSNSQKTRVLTEDWLKRNVYCPVCGAPHLTKYQANKPVADFYCDNCRSDFELKSRESKSGKLGTHIPDGAYYTMIERIMSLNNPNFFFMTYSDYKVSNLIFVPNMFFVPDMIDKRTPLQPTARRAGWTGCNINIKGIPDSGKIFIIKDGSECDKSQVIEHYHSVKRLTTNNIVNRGWIMDVLRCIENIRNDEFTLTSVYSYADALKIKHPDNQFIHAKIRQQLQILRDRGFIEFVSRGKYRKLIKNPICIR